MPKSMIGMCFEAEFFTNKISGPLSKGSKYSSIRYLSKHPKTIIQLQNPRYAFFGYFESEGLGAAAFSWVLSGKLQGRSLRKASL